MPPVALLSAFAAALTCYLTGVLLGGWLGGVRLVSGQEDYLEKQLRVEARDLISQIILAALERDEVPTLRDIAQQCPKNLSSGKAWAIWTAESNRMLKRVMAED